MVAQAQPAVVAASAVVTFVSLSWFSLFLTSALVYDSLSNREQWNHRRIPGIATAATLFTGAIWIYNLKGFAYALVKDFVVPDGCQGLLIFNGDHDRNWLVFGFPILATLLLLLNCGLHLCQSRFCRRHKCGLEAICCDGCLDSCLDPLDPTNTVDAVTKAKLDITRKLKTQLLFINSDIDVIDIDSYYAVRIRRRGNPRPMMVDDWINEVRPGA